MRPLLPATLILTLASCAACDGGAGAADGGAGVVIGPEGGTVSADGFVLTVPEGALEQPVAIRILPGETGAPEVPERVRISKAYLVLPETLRFLTPASVALRYEPGRLPEEVSAASADLRRTDFSRALERLGALALDESAAMLGGETLSLGTFWATAPVARRPATVELTPELKVIDEGQTAQYEARVKDQAGRPLPGAAVTWSSSDPEVATVDSQGLATGHVAGIAKISARAGAALAVAEIRVASTAPFQRAFTWENPLPQGAAVTAVSGSGEALVLATAAGSVFEREGAGWRHLATLPATRLNAFAGAGASLIAVGTQAGQGVVLRPDPTGISATVVRDTELLAAWTDGQRGLAVGAGPNVASLEQGAWKVVPSPTTEPLLAVDGSTGTMTVFGALGSVYQRAGAAWAPVVQAPLDEWQLAAAAAEGAAWSISGKNLRKFEAGAWRQVALPGAPPKLVAVGLAGSRALVAGEDESGAQTIFLEGEDGSFTAWPVGRQRIRVLRGTLPADAYAGGERGLLLRWSGAGWEDLREGPSEDLAGLLVEPGPVAFAAFNRCADLACTARRGVVHERSADGRFRPLGFPFSTRLRALGGLSAGDYWAVGDGAVAYHWNGRSFLPTTVPEYSAFFAVEACDGVAYAGGQAGVYAWLDEAWVKVAASGWTSFRSLSCSGGAVWAVGDYTIMKVQGTGTMTLDPEMDGLPQAVWRAVYVTGKGQAFVGGESGTILRWMGEHFEGDSMPGNLDVKSVEAFWGTGFGNVWAVGELQDGRGFLVHFDGARWVPVETGADRPLTHVRGLPGGDLWVGGESGAVLRGRLIAE